MSIAARGLAFGFPRRVVGRDLDVALEAGEVLCVLGPNGAGKTTLFRTLLGLLPPLGGRVLIDGDDLAAMPREAIARAVAYVPQSSAMAFDFTLEEVVVMGRSAHLGPFAAPQRRDFEIARAALDRLGIAALADRPFGEVSGGERPLIARALATEARAIVMDEPTANLDFGNQARVLGEIARLRGAGISILLCSHDPDHAFQVADRVMLLENGRVLDQGEARAVLTVQNLSQLYRVPAEVIMRAVPSRTV